jgi:beta-glucanase (GH16 family)
MKRLIDLLESRRLLNSATIGGRVFFDQNQDGLTDGALTAPPAVVYLDLNNNAQRDSGERSMKVNRDGTYRFTNVAAGTLRVRAELSMLFSQTLPTLNSGRRIDVVTGRSYANRDFGFRQRPTGTISGIVFDDTNGNGTRDSNETGLANARVIADLNRNGQADSNDQVTGYTTSSGTYSLQVPSGTVRVFVDLDRANDGRADDEQRVATRPGPTGMALTVATGSTVRRNFGADVEEALDSSVRPLIVGDDASRADDYRLSWADEFEGTTLDATKWSLFEPGARRDAIITNDAVEVGNGELTLHTFTDNGIHKNAIISTDGKFQQRYGYFEARINFASATGMWSAFWLISNDMREGGRAEMNPGRADLYGTEIDIAEHRSNNFWQSPIADRITGNVHMDGYLEPNHKSMEYMSGPLGLDSGYHTYGVDWRENEMRFYADGQLWWTVNQAEADRVGVNSNPISGIEQFILLSSEAQNNAWAGPIPSGGYGAKGTVFMKVDWVRVFARRPA